MAGRNISNSLKLGVLFASVAMLSACADPVQPVQSQSLPRTAEDVKYERHREYQLLMVRNGCEVGREVFIGREGSRRESTDVIALCPQPGATDIQPDNISVGLSFNVMHSRFGCEVGKLKEGHHELATVTLCPAHGEAAAEHTVRTGKTSTARVAIAQRRPG